MVEPPIDKARTGTGRDRWRARICAASGAVLGAGIVLDGRHVLTCAHLVPPQATPGPGGTRSWDQSGPGELLQVDAVDWSPVRHSEARVLADHWIPRSPSVDHSGGGDLAVLELREPLPVPAGALLHPGPVRRGTALWAYGFPHSGISGVWGQSVVAGMSGELVQLDGVPGRGAEVDHGFSGAAVVDTDNWVLGLVTSKLVAEGKSISWMMPVATILRYLPHLARYVRPPSAEVTRVAAALAQTRSTLVIVIGDRNAQRAEVVSLLPPSNAEPSIIDSGETEQPSLPSLDVLVDASGLSTREVVQRIAADLGLQAAGASELMHQLRGSQQPIVVRVDGVDEAVHPDTLMSEVLLPITELGSVIAGFQEDPRIVGDRTTSVHLTSGQLVTGGSQTAGLPVVGPGTAQPPIAPPTRRLARLNRMIIELREAETAAAGVTVQFTDVTLPKPQANKFRVRLTAWQLRPQTDELAAFVQRTESTVAAALRQNRRLVSQNEERRELRGLLEADQAQAMARLPAEDPVLAALFDLAWTALRRNPCDLAACRAAVVRYESAIWEQLDLDPPGSSVDPAPRPGREEA